MKTLYLNGTIITMEEGTAQAVLEEDGIITAVGEEEALKAMAKGARVVDLDGKTMLPAFIDAHSHFSAYANSMLQIPLEEVVTFGELKEKIREYIEKNNIPEENGLLPRGSIREIWKNRRIPPARCWMRRLPIIPF